MRKWNGFHVVIFCRYSCLVFDVRDLENSKQFVEAFDFYDNDKRAIFLLDDGNMPLIQRYNPNVPKRPKEFYNNMFLTETGHSMDW